MSLSSSRDSERPSKAKAASSKRLLLAEAAIALMAAIIFAVIMFDLLNIDGYVGRWYAAASGGHVWPFAGRCLLLPCSHQ